MEASIKNLNEVAQQRAKMIGFIVNELAYKRSYTSDNQYDKLEKTISKKSFHQLEKQYNTLIKSK